MADLMPAAEEAGLTQLTEQGGIKFVFEASALWRGLAWVHAHFSACSADSGT